MKLLLIHSDWIEWQAIKKAIKNPEETDKDKKKVEETLVVFTAIEKCDEQNQKEAVKKSTDEIKKVYDQIKAHSIVLYPYAHLSSNLSSLDVGLQIMKEMEVKLKKQNFKTFRAPFGWYKSFNIKCKGHPLSELSKTISFEGENIMKKSGQVKLISNEKIDPHKLLREISKTKLSREKLKENDHRIIGQKMDLFSFSETAPGMVFWHNNGLIIYNELIKFWRNEHRKAGYQEIATPQILDQKLWEISGHWEKFKDHIFLTEYENRTFAVKPMNCPGGMLVYKATPKSYKDLPLRIGELGTVHRQELSGVLTGLFRVIKFTQDDAHIFCTEEQLKSEIEKILDLIDLFYKKFGFKYEMELSTRPEKRIGSEKLWDKSEKILENVLKSRKTKFKINKGDGAFYGPKIDFHIKDSQERSWQCATVQLDFAMPERFELEYKGEDNKPHTPVMLHRVIYGALERFIGILLEHLDGNLPLWLAPVQVRVLNFTERNSKAAEKIHKKFIENGIRSDLDLGNETVQLKVRKAAIEKIPYIILIGDKEEKNKTLAIRGRDGKVKYNVKINDFITKTVKNISDRV